MLRVRIVHEHLVYVDTLARALEQLGPVEIVEDSSAEVDVVLFPLGGDRQPQMHLLPAPVPDAKLIAYSDQGDYGLVRLPGENGWTEVHPFGLDQLLLEVLAGRARPQHGAGPNRPDMRLST